MTSLGLACGGIRSTVPPSVASFCVIGYLRGNPGLKDSAEDRVLQAGRNRAPVEQGKELGFAARADRSALTSRLGSDQ